MVEGLEDRLGAVRRGFVDVLDLGCFDQSFSLPGTRIVRCDAGTLFSQNGVRAEEDALPFAEASFDLVVSAGVLDTVNDLPGALVQIRRALRPGGLFLGAFAGAGTLAVLRAAFRDAERDAPAARFHPQIDVRAAGDLMLRAGFTLPVADTETLFARYGNLFKLVADLRGMAATNMLVERSPLTKGAVGRAASAFADSADADGRVSERFNTIFLTGWAPETNGS
jgi:SAM-dependent methyltransferase